MLGGWDALVVAFGERKGFFREHGAIYSVDALEVVAETLIVGTRTAAT